MFASFDLATNIWTVFSHLVSVSVTFGGITWSALLFGFTMVSVIDFAAVCIIYTHIRFMRGICIDYCLKHDTHTRCQVSQPKVSHVITFVSRLHSSPGLPGSHSLRPVSLCFLRVTIRLFTKRMKSLEQVILYREFKSSIGASPVPTLLILSAQRVHWHSGFFPLRSILEMEGG